MKNNTTDGNSMTVSFSTERGSWLAVKVAPLKDGNWYAIKRDVFQDHPSTLMESYVVQMYDFGPSTREAYDTIIKLDESKYIIIGLVDELTEEQWKGVVDYIEWATGYRDYQKEIKCFDTATESGHSLLSSLEVFSKNPYGKFADYVELSVSDSQRDKQVAEWRKCEHRTGTWLLLKKEG